ncbi:hypothetical protein [Polaribacter sp.]|uniref:hypothetical protein n=1 Tax=Polaribacter sp. TaxID=1920175 RepID=UPI003EF2050C
MTQKYILLFLLTLFLNNKNVLAFHDTSTIKHTIPSSEISLDDELLQKLKTSLASIYKSNKIDFKDFNATKSNDEILFTGTFVLYRVKIKLEVIFDTNKELKSLTGRLLNPSKGFTSRQFKKLTKGNSDLENWFPKVMKKNITFDNFAISFDENSKKPSEISVSIATVNGFKIIENSPLNFNNIIGTVTTKNPVSGAKVSASLTGEFNIGPTVVKSTASVGSSSEDWAFKGELENLSLTNVLKSVVGSIGTLPMPDKVIDININNSSFTVIPSKKSFSLTGIGAVSGTKIGELQLKIAPEQGSKLGFMVGISPSSDFKMANIDPNLKILDDLKITNFGLVLSSYSSSKGNLDVFKKLGGESSIGRGFNFIGAFDLKPTNLDDLIGLESVMIRAVVSNKLSDLLLEGALNTNINLGKSATFKKVLFRVKPSPTNFKISMGGVLEVKVDKDVLAFSAEMGVDITDQAIFITGLMNGKWNDPFGAKGVAIANLGATLGVSFRTTPIPLPEIGIKGELQIKEFNGDLLVYLNANNPSESAIDAGFNRVSLKAILEEFCDQQTLRKIPSDIRKTILDVNLEDARLTIAARPLTIMEKDFDPGFRIKGTANIGEIAGAKLDVQVGYEGIDATAGIKKISHLPFFELKGARGKEDPIIRILAKASTESKVVISGSATLLGLNSETDLLLNDKGFDLYMNGKIFNVFNAKLEVTGSRVKDGGSFRIAATMEQDFMKYLTKHASDEIDKATKKTQQDITTAQNKISNAQLKLNSLNTNIANMRNTVKAERKRDLDNIKNARQSVVNEKRKHFNDIVNNINSINRKVNAAHAGIAKKKKEIANANVFEKPALALKYTPYFTEQAFIISTQETAKVTQQGYREVAKVALKAAEESVGLVHTLGSKTPIDADPRIVALIGSKETANAAMIAGKGILEGAKIVGVGTLGAAKWIVENGPTSVVNITYAHFEAKLNAAHGGAILVRMKGTFAGKPLDEKFTINFKDPLKSSKDFAQSLL